MSLPIGVEWVPADDGWNLVDRRDLERGEQIRERIVEGKPTRADGSLTVWREWFTGGETFANAEDAKAHAEVQFHATEKKIAQLLKDFEQEMRDKKRQRFRERVIDDE